MSKSPNILLFGGTTEGKATANWLNDMGFSFYYSTKTPSAFRVPQDCIKMDGALSVDEMFAFCQEKKIKVIIDAAHPYATELHHNIAACAKSIDLPFIRVERSFIDFPESSFVSYVSSLDEMVRYVCEHGYTRVLSLLGVKSVDFLHRQLNAQQVWYRILDRQLSWDTALECGVEQNRIIASSAFENLNDAKTLIEEQNIEVLLTKDSGFHGLFHHKVEIANNYKIPLLVLERPTLPVYNELVKCRADLRMAIQKYLILPKLELANGFTTGTCAAICTKAAANLLMGAERSVEEFIFLPDGEKVTMPIHTSGVENGSAFITVIKNSGDDPDLTDGMVIGCHLSLNYTGEIQFVQGEGVGTVRLPGLGLPIGEPAVNKVPRLMIVKELERIRDDYELEEGFDVSIFIPHGKQLAEKTFNPRLGVEGGLSIIGSTGRIKPFSSEAYVETIKRQIDVVCENKGQHVIMNSGGRSERYLKKHFHDLSDFAFVQYGNYIGEALKTASNRGLTKVSMGIMTGKAVKLAEGHLDTHSRNVVMNKAFIHELAESCGYEDVILNQVKDITMARELETIFQFSLEEPFFKLLKSKCQNACSSVVNGFELDIILINNEGKII